MDKFNLKSILKPLNVVKRSGFLVSTIIMILVTLPFVGKDSIWAFFSSKLNKLGSGQKDVFYGLKNNSDINWRALLSGIVKRFQILLSSSDETTNLIRAIIIDDTVAKKTGKHIEHIGYVHDHVSGRFVLGYKILVVGYWDGVSFIPIDFSIHREKRDKKLKELKERIEKKETKLNDLNAKKKQHQKKVSILKQELKEIIISLEVKKTKGKQRKLEAKTKAINKTKTRLSGTKQKIVKQKQDLQHLKNTYHEQEPQSGKCGLKPKDYDKQFKKKRNNNTPGYKRIKESDNSKIDNAISMIKKAFRQGFQFEYVLTDSWFFSGKFLAAITSLGKTIKLVSMAKINNAKYNILPKNNLFAPKQIISLYKRKAKTNRTYNAKYIKVQAEYQGIRVVMFFINIGKGENWRF